MVSYERNHPLDPDVDLDRIVYICDWCLEWFYSKNLVTSKLNEKKDFCCKECLLAWEAENKHDYVDD